MAVLEGEIWKQYENMWVSSFSHFNSSTGVISTQTQNRLLRSRVNPSLTLRHGVSGNRESCRGSSMVLMFPGNKLSSLLPNTYQVLFPVWSL